LEFRDFCKKISITTLKDFETVIILIVFVSRKPKDLIKMEEHSWISRNK
jgi:hypothetical protein